MQTRGALLAAGLFGAFGSASRSPVYVTGPSIQSDSIGSGAPSISWSNARLYLADRAGVSDEYSLDGADGSTLGLLSQIQGAQQRLFAGEARNGVRRTVVIVEGVHDPEELLGSDVKPHFYVDKAPTMSESLHTVSTLLKQDRDRQRAEELCGSWMSTNDIKDSIQGGFSMPDPFGTCELDSIQSGGWWQGLSIPEKFDLLSASASVLSRIYGKNVPSSRTDSVTAVFHVWTLHELAASDGVTSSLYRSSRAALKKSLLKLRDSGVETTIVLSPYSRSSTPKRTAPGLHVAQEKRADGIFDVEAAASTSPSETGFPKTTIATCYSDESACISATANCTGHGACALRWTEMDSDEEMGAECWACACRPSVLVEGGAGGHGRKTIYWGGPACQKKDISVPFWLFAGFAVAMAAALSYGVGVLYSIGETELPSVLGAGVGPGARAK